MWHHNIRGYVYDIVEVYPMSGHDCGIRVLTSHDRLEDAEKVIAVLESVNYNFTSYGMMMRPVWDNEASYREAKRDACDHSGASTSLSMTGEYVFHCYKCGKHEEQNTNGEKGIL